MATWGTSYFVSRQAAERYYRDYEDDPKQAVKRKLAAGEIHIGVPHLKTGEKLTRIDGGLRYAITENPSRSTGAMLFRSKAAAKKYVKDHRIKGYRITKVKRAK